MAELREPAVLLAHSSRSWMQEVHFFIVDHGGALVAGYALSADDAVSGDADVLVIDDTCSFLSRRLVDDLHRAGTAVLGVFDPRDGGSGSDRLLRLGVDDVLPAHAPPEEFLAAIGDLERAAAPPGFAETSVSETGRDANVVAVVAASAGAGATEVAIGTASRMRSLGADVSLVDADERTPSIAQRLGLAPDPNLETAIEGMLEGIGDVEDCVARSHGLPVLCGPPYGLRAGTTRPADAAGVIRALARRHAYVVVNVCAGPATGSDAGVAGAVLDLAFAVVLVGTASPVGMVRIATWLEASRTTTPRIRLHVVLNRFPGGGYRSNEIVVELQRLARPESITLIPTDDRVQDAEWRGTPVRRGPFRRAVTRVASRLLASATS